MAFTKARSAPERTAGATSGAVMLRAVRQRPPPRISADSSIEASTDPSALAASGERNGGEGGRREAEDVADEAVDEAGVRAPEVDEGDRGQERGGEVSDGGGQMEEALAGDVGAADRPGQRQADGDAE